MRALAIALVALPLVAHADPPQLAAIAPADDVRAAIAIGFEGAAFAGDGKGGWARIPGTGVSRTVGSAARGPAGVIAGADGAVFRLADNGWTAIRLAQKGKPLLGVGPRAVAALGREIFELDHGHEPTRLVQLDGPVTALAAGPRGVLARTDRATYRLTTPPSRAARPTPLANVPATAQLVGDRWAIADAGRASQRALDVTTGRATALAADLAIAAATEAPGGDLVLVAGVRGGGLALVAIPATRGTLVRSPIDGVAGTPVGIVADGHDRVAIALRDGRIALRDRGKWVTAIVQDAAPIAHAGSPPATAP